MLTDSILLKFLITLTLVFFIPKIINRYIRIPSPITEIILGAILVYQFPTYFFSDSLIDILSTLGIISLFVYSGMEVDTQFIRSNKRFYIENSLRHIAVLALVVLGMKQFFNMTYQTAIIVGIALTTPSASYILSALKEDDNRRSWIEGKAIAGEVLSLLLLVIVLNLDSYEILILKLLAVMALITILPIILEILYVKVFNKLVGTEFSFIFVIALCSAFLTEFIGVHFLLGAFIAGIVSKRFLIDMKSYYYNKNHDNKNIMVGFGSFAAIFVPFYFLNVGLKLEPTLLSQPIIITAFIMCVSISILRILSLSLHRKFRLKEGIVNSLRTSYMIIPTIVLTFIIAQILLEEFDISKKMYNILMAYGLLTALLTFLLSLFLERKNFYREDY